MIQLHGIGYSIGQRVLFENLSLVIAPGDRFALIGPNGTGKTTLIRVAVGQLEPDTGTRILSRGTRLGYLPQEAAERFEGTVLDRAMEAHRSFLEMRDELTSLHEQMELMRPEDPGLETTLARAGELQSHLEMHDERLLEPEARRVLSGLGFASVDQDRPLAEFSGGWRMRAALAALLLADPTVIFLDEPTNHLDLPAMEWLEDYLKGFRGGLVVVSHDRVFLDRVATEIRELEAGALQEYAMGFTEYLNEKERRREQIEAQNLQVDQKVAQLTRFVERFGAKNTKATQAQSKLKQIDRLLETRRVLPAKARSIQFRFPAPPHAGRLLLTLKDAAVGYDTREIVSDVDLTIARADKMAIVGANGAGKTTLLRLLAAQLEPRRGERRIFDLTQMAYFAQHAAETLDGAMTVLEAVEEVAPDAWRTQIRSLLGTFLFSGADVFKACRVLSGGERQRVALARILLTPANLLLLDEPTHHLDLAGKKVLEDALEQYPGAVVVVTHDRSLMARVATRVVEVNAGRAVLYPGGYDDWESARVARSDKLSAPAATDAVRATRAESGASPQERSSSSAREEREARRREEKARAARQKQVAQLERDIESREESLRNVERRLADPSQYGQGEAFTRLLGEYQTLKRELEGLWKKLAEIS